MYGRLNDPLEGDRLAAALAGRDVCAVSALP
jgi:hypothetical protein